ncbi:MAG: gliding motility-associated C-terminal domain-containing protein [Bacteroidota bacterium]|nr:gliding motility-associated C-terminal domain-containing protein [Bacteroidota bacterium]
MKLKLPGLVFYFLLSFTPLTQGQFCNGSLGDPIINVTFGTTSSMLSPTVTTFSYARGCPKKGEYTTGNLIFGCGETPDAHSWHMLAGDHTHNLNGQFMLVNAESTKGVIHTDTATQLCGNTNYQYSAWIANVMEKVLACGGAPILPNITFSVTTLSGQVLATTNTGDIPMEDSRVWNQYGLTFTTPPDVNAVILTLSTNPKFGCGNAFVVDDITFSVCGPAVTATIDGSKDPANVCADYTNPFKLNASYSSGFNNPSAQWQSSLDSGKTWSNIPGENALSYQIPHRSIGAISYRLAVAEGSNINSKNCQVLSNVIYTEVHPVPPHNSPKNILGCKDKTLLLPQADPSALEVDWTGPNGYISKNPKSQVPNVTYTDTGIYQLKQIFYFGCTSVDTFNLKVFPSTTIATQSLYSLCEGDRVHLFASGNGSFKWKPSSGLSNDAIPDPIANPNDSTVYEVVVTNSFGCQDSTEVTINVYKNPKASAGADKEIMLGDTLQLNGMATGTNINFSWSPSAFINNINVLNPFVFPTTETEYTLTVNSNVGCGIATSRVYVKVFKDIYIPSAFTPNGDGLNDNFKIRGANSYTIVKLLVYDRFGKLLFNGKNSDNGWNGTFKGVLQPVGVYIYYVEMLSPAHKRIVRKGSVLLLN